MSIVEEMQQISTLENISNDDTNVLFLEGNL